MSLNEVSLANQEMSTDFLGGITTKFLKVASDILSGRSSIFGHLKLLGGAVD